MTSPTPFATGSCLCHSIHYTLTAPPFASVICHCVNCRKSSGVAFATNALFQSTALQIPESPDLKTFEDKDTLSGSTVSRKFCGKCGSNLFATNSVREELVVVMNGTIDNDEGSKGARVEALRPSMEIFCKDKRGWFPEGDVLDRKDVM